MKEAYYFSHDSNARHDPKVTAMRGVYGAQGYGWFWMLVEMMREEDGYRLDMRSKYAFNAYAMQLQSESNAIASFVHDCINEFELFQSDGDYFWSESLHRRMKNRDEKSEKARESANARWQKRKKNTNASKDNTNASKNDALKESKLKELKKEINKEKKLHGDFILLTDTEHEKLKNDISESETQYYIDTINDWFVQDPKRLESYSDHNRMIRTWKRRDDKNKKNMPRARQSTTALLELHTPSREAVDHYEQALRIRHNNAGA